MARPTKSESEALIEAYGRVATKAVSKLEAMLDDPKADLSAANLNFIAGTATDKIAKYEQWEKTTDGNANEWVEKLVAGLRAAHGTQVTLTVEALPEKARDVEVRELPEINVTPVRRQLEERKG